ncbi:uncharacterized protein LOC131437606 isoform X2 [Malaya genurostris]|uniref:uncharacterized protein LOC131437606 isoform X2 n=1 Tax=Malaya genurostris TaxID=325434 RepID=UPI0026F3E680|nr:uncharacterized protein LOC131437606 isoform X2 [Malaya genurostris]
MPCESCHAQFGLITRKKSCYECRRLFCRNCLEKRQERILCHNCLIFTKRPLSKVDLGQLKVKDLIFYLQSKHISTAGCVEKDDLINLVIAHVNSGTNSPRSPSGSAGSGNGRTFNVSSASSTGGSSGGGRGSNSGGSSRYGNFYAASVENCANTYDQIRNTCQNLFTSITDKLGTEESLRQREGGQENVSQQPRFGNNDVYRVNFQQSNNDNRNVPAAESGQATDPSDIVSNERNLASNHGDTSDGSGITSGADSSGNSSSVSSPVGQQQGSTAVRIENVNLSLSVRIDNILASEANQNGCECSDEEGDLEAKETPRRKDSKKSASEDNLIAEAGPSQSTVGRMTVPESKTDTSSSSFDELNPECVYTLPGAPIDNAFDVEHWQIINNPDILAMAAITTATMTESTDNPDVQKSTEKLLETHSRVVPCSSRIPRRRSDSCLLIEMNRQTTGSPLEPALGTASSTGHSSQNQSTVYATNKCFKCGKRRSGIKKQLKKFRKQLESGTDATEAAQRQQLEAFLNYLERRSKGSFELTDSDSITEEASLAEVEPIEGTSSGNAATSHSSYPQMDGDDPESIHVYSAGNQELASKSHIKLGDIKESADLDILSVKQLKEILMLNRVDFKGCCEKPELRERVLRLWRDYKSIPSIEKLPSDDLCKICMDAPIECVILECGHMTTCTACGKVLSECPICRQYIVRVVRFFRA